VTHRSVSRPLAICLTTLFTLALVAAFAVASAPAHAQLPDPGGILPDPGGLPGLPGLPAPDDPGDDNDDRGVAPAPGAPQITETPRGAVAAGGGPLEEGTSPLPLLLLGGVTLAGAGALVARRRATAAARGSDG